MRVLLVVYDNESYVHEFPLGIAYLASVLRKAGHTVEIYKQDVRHYPEAHLTEYLNKNKFDVIGAGVTAGYYQYHKLLKISQAINRSKKRPFYVIGGHGPTPEPEFFLKKTGADVVVMGEGEDTVVDLMPTLAAKRSLAHVRGIAFREGKLVVVNERRPLIADIDRIPRPAYDLFPMEYYRLLRMPKATKTDLVFRMLSGRGCKFNCVFCYRMDGGLRLRSREAIVDEIKFLKKEYGITYISFADELLMTSEERIASLCEYFIKSKVNVKWSCCGRLNYAKPKMLKIMKRAGCVFVNYGIESMDDEVLKNMRKALTTKHVVSGIKATLKARISPGLNMIFGNIGDTKETLRKSLEFLLKYDDGAQLRTIRPVTPYPGSPLYYTAIEKGLLKGCEDFYEDKHVNSDLLTVNFTELSDSEFYRCLLEANTKLIKNYFNKKLNSTLKEARGLYLDLDEDFRGFRQT